MTHNYRLRPPNIDDHIVRAGLKKENLALCEWPRKWGWMLNEYRDLKNRLSEVTEKSVVFVRDKEISDSRTVGPIPKTVNGEYGWLANRSEFDLNLFGPVFKSKHGNLPTKFRLQQRQISNL